MRAHIVVAHPEPASFNGQLFDLSQRTLKGAGWDVTRIDLYRNGFDPCEGPRHFQDRVDEDVFHAQSEQRHGVSQDTLPPDVDVETENLLGCDLLVIHFPLWWFGMPAILKGWMDRVFVYGRMYKSAMRYDAGICAGKKMIACVTTGASADNCSYNGREGDTHLHLWPVLFPFRYLGFEVYQPEILHGVGGVAFIEGQETGLSRLDSYKSQWASTLSTLQTREKVPYNRDDEFDETTRLVPGSPVHSPFIRHDP